MKKQFSIRTSICSLAVLSATGCTGQIPGAFRLAQQEQTFNSQLQVNTKIDLLWVVDNSSSMDVAQDKLRRGFKGFADKYMQPTWDIRSAVITTDTYLSNPAFSAYLNSTIPGTVNWASPHINGRLSTFVNPAYNPNLVNKTNGKFESGVKFIDMIPAWGSSYSRLLPGLHDGPIAALCFEALPYFINGATKCAIRDNQILYNGAEKCLNPDTGAGESSITQCVNTVQNDTIRSGKAILSTMPSNALSELELTAWTQQLSKDFMVNVTTGSVGHGSERGLGSVLQLLSDNEKTQTAFFRAGSLRAIIFVTDEDDQTFRIEETPPSNFNPFSNYQCDQASLVAMNGAGSITGNNGFCCSDSSKNCRFGSEGTSCPTKSIDGHSYALSLCPVAEKLLPVSEVKDELDSFFLELDYPGEKTEDKKPNYLVMTLTPLTGESIETLQNERNNDDIAAGGFRTMATDRGDRYIELGNLVGNGSAAMDLAAEDYSPILDTIGAAIVRKMSTFTLSRAPTGSEDMIVSINHANGSSTVIPPEKYTIEGNSIVIDSAIVLGFASTDRISINYEPKSVY